MANVTEQEIAFLLGMNDNHAIKRHELAREFRDHTLIHSLYSDIFAQSGTNPIENYSRRFQQLIKRALEIRQKGLLPNYCDTLHHYQKMGIAILPIHNPLYPEKLMKIRDPPIILYSKGDTTSLSKPAIAVIGTREISRRGEAMVYEVVEHLVSLGYVIVSGLAHGTDTHAHTAAIEYGGVTIAVLPGDIMSIIPKDNRNLAMRIAESGLLVSEITDRAGMHKGRYIERNRITSGLSEAVVVIETGAKGGSIRQAETALSQGRPIYVLKPDDTRRDAVAGYQKLLSMGAIPVGSPQELSGCLRTRNQDPIPRVMTLSDFS